MFWIGSRRARAELALGSHRVLPGPTSSHREVRDSHNSSASSVSLDSETSASLQANYQVDHRGSEFLGGTFCSSSVCLDRVRLRLLVRNALLLTCTALGLSLRSSRSVGSTPHESVMIVVLSKRHRSVLARRPLKRANNRRQRVPPRHLVQLWSTTKALLHTSSSDLPLDLRPKCRNHFRCLSAASVYQIITWEHICS
jgi:hypothetical protein